MLFFVLFFWSALFGGEFLLTWDPLVYSYPLRTIAWEMIRQGSLPLWTPHVFSGYPLLSMAQLGIGYPLTWGYLFLPGHWAEQIYVLAPYLLAPLFTYIYAREVGRSRIASLLAGLSFGYGGMMASWLANGMMTNAVMWLPLVLTGIHRARARSYASCLLLATVAYTMSVMTGIGQGFLYVGIVAVVYAAFISASSGAALESGQGRWLSWQRWKPLAVVVGAMMLSAGVATFQILETRQMVRQSIRRALDYEDLGELSMSFSMGWQSLLLPLFHHEESTAYLHPLALGLAVLAIVTAVRQPQREAHIFFWLAVAVVAGVLMLGTNTPLYRLVHRIPWLNLFRAPSRHSFEWTFAISMLSAYGWDAWREMMTRKQSAASSLRRLVIGSIILALGAVVGVLWWRAMPDWLGLYSITDLGATEMEYVLWKVALAILIVIAIWQGWRINARRWRHALLLGGVLLACFIEAFILFSKWWGPPSLPANRFTAVSPVTRFLQQYPPEQNRVYTRVKLFVEQHATEPRLDPPNLTALYGLHNVAGYEPLVWERYSRALGDVWLDAVTPLSGAKPDFSLFDERSHVLDLLNTTYVAAFTNLELDRVEKEEKDDDEAVFPLPDTQRWQPVYDRDGAIILRNHRALPRVWLVGEAEAVDGEEALRRIRGESRQLFDPRRTALLEVSPQALPALPGGTLSENATARLAVYEPNRLVIETSADQPSVLVVSEMNYPQWEAWLDGVKAPIYTANYLLRGVTLPGGSHRVEMRYTAPAARRGAWVSIFTLLLIGMIAIRARRTLAQ